VRLHVEGVVEVPHEQDRLAQLGQIVHRAAREQHLRTERGLAEVDEAVLEELGVEDLRQPPEHVERLLAVLEEAEDAGHAQRRTEANAALGADAAVELIALDAIEHRQIVAADGRVVHLDAHGAVRAELDVARPGAELARPAAALRRDGGQTQRRRIGVRDGG
jgi:hypothetical protein